MMLANMWSFIILSAAFILSYSDSTYFPKGTLKDFLIPLTNKYVISLLIIGALVLIYLQRGFYTGIFIWLYQMGLVIALLQLSMKFLEYLKIKK